MAKLLGISVVLVSLFPSFAKAETAAFSVIFGGKNISHVVADTERQCETRRLSHQKPRPRADHLRNHSDGA